MQSQSRNLLNAGIEAYNRRAFTRSSSFLLTIASHLGTDQIEKLKQKRTSFFAKGGTATTSTFVAF